MRKIIFLILIICLLSPQTLAKEEDIINFKDDKILHYGGGVITYYIASKTNTKHPMKYVLVVAVSKELIDNWTNGHIEEQDIVATMLGGISMKLLTFEF
jgi:NADH:ubiquinone oxidoreductase subunit F (NADH-binding)